MYNKCLLPLWENDPKKTIKLYGIIIRKIIYPILRLMIPFTTKYSLLVVERGYVPPKEPILFVSTHAFREDVEAAFVGAGRAAYILNGSVSVVMRSVDGITNWIVGMILVDRTDKSSRRAAKEKMIYALQHGASVIMYPEGTWNKSPNEMTSGLFPGVYDVAKAAGARVVAIASIRVGENIYIKTGNAFDISQMERSAGLELVKEHMATLRWDLMEKFSKCSRSELPQGKEAITYWEGYIDDLMAEVPFYDYEVEKHTKYIDKNICSPAEAFGFMKVMVPKYENAFLYRGNEYFL